MRLQSESVLSDSDTSIFILFFALFNFFFFLFYFIYLFICSILFFHLRSTEIFY